jgi:glyoxylase-like metal-dependent hydrolase (beta-lactamase superfamily II)
MPERITLIERAMPETTDTVRSALVAGTHHRLVVDTLMRPADMAPFHGATLILYTHHDWDHCWGSSAFPGVPIIGHRLTGDQMRSSAEQEKFAAMSLAHPGFFAGSRLIPPDITFTDQLTIDLGGLTVQLYHMPGHTADSVIAHVVELGVLLAGDWAEDPLPSCNESGQIRAWAAQLRAWSSRPLAQIIPSHGNPSGVELLHRNATYLEELIGEVDRGLQRGATVAELITELPVERFLPTIAQYPAYYRDLHPRNVAAVALELA